MMCSAETVISVLQIPLQLKLLHPWNRGIHGYIRSHVKGCLSVSLFSGSPHLFPHSSFERNHCATSRSPTAMIWFCKDLQRNNFNNTDEDRLAIKYLWIMNANHITSAITCLTLREWNPELLQFSATEAAGWNIVYEHPQYDIFAVFRTTCYLDNAILSFKPIATLSHSRNQMCLKCILLQGFTPQFKVKMRHRMGWDVQKILNYDFNLSLHKGQCQMIFLPLQCWGGAWWFKVLNKIR